MDKYWLCVCKNSNLIYAVFFSFPVFNQLFFYSLGKIIPIKTPSFSFLPTGPYAGVPFTQFNDIAGVPKYFMLPTHLIVFCMF